MAVLAGIDKDPHADGGVNVASVGFIVATFVVVVVGGEMPPDCFMVAFTVCRLDPRIPTS